MIRSFLSTLIVTLTLRANITTTFGQARNNRNTETEAVIVPQPELMAKRKRQTRYFHLGTKLELKIDLSSFTGESKPGLRNQRCWYSVFRFLLQVLFFTIVPVRSEPAHAFNSYAK